MCTVYLNIICYIAVRLRVKSSGNIVFMDLGIIQDA